MACLLNLSVRADSSGDPHALPGSVTSPDLGEQVSVIWLIVLGIWETAGEATAPRIPVGELQARMQMRRLEPANTFRVQGCVSALSGEHTGGLSSRAYAVSVLLPTASVFWRVLGRQQPCQAVICL